MHVLYPPRVNSECVCLQCLPRGGVSTGKSSGPAATSVRQGTTTVHPSIVFQWICCLVLWLSAVEVASWVVRHTRRCSRRFDLQALHPYAAFVSWRTPCIRDVHSMCRWTCEGTAASTERGVAIGCGVWTQQTASNMWFSALPVRLWASNTTRLLVHQPSNVTAERYMIALASYHSAR